jgi:hypothetical protein
VTSRSPNDGSRVGRFLQSIASGLIGLLLFAGCSARPTAVDRGRTNVILHDPLLDISIQGATPDSIHGSVGVGNSPGASPSLAGREWEIAGSLSEAFVSVVRQLPDSQWHLDSLTCGPGMSLALLASKSYPFFTATATARTGDSPDLNRLFLSISSPPDQGPSNPVTVPATPTRVLQPTPCPDAVLAAVRPES